MLFSHVKAQEGYTMMFNYLKLGLLFCLTACSPVSTPQQFSDGVASVSSPLALSPDGNTLWVVNPDANSVTPVDTKTLTTGTSLEVGQEPWGVVVTTRAVIVLNRADGTLSLLEGKTRTNIPVGPEPGGVALSPSGNLAYVTVSSSDEVTVVDLVEKQVTKRISVGRMPWAIAVTDDGDTDDTDEKIIITHRLARLRPDGEEATDDGKEGWLSVIEGDHVKEISLPPYEFGFTNGLEGLAVSSENVLVTHLLNQPEEPRDFQNTVSGAVSTVSLTTEQELSERRIHLNEATFSTPVNFPRAIALSPDSKTAFVVLAGSDAVMGIDVSVPEQAKLLGFWQTGKNPRGIVINKDGTRAYVMNNLSRDVSVLDLTDTSNRSVIATIPVTTETLEPDLLRGKILFNNANDPRLSHLGWMSCASCHHDGGVDGTTWLSPDGPRQTQPLWNLQDTAPFHASATRDEVQDAEVDIESLLDGVGLAPGAALPELGKRNGSTSADLDSLARFVLEGIRVPKARDITSQQEERGREVFLKAGCQQCHVGAHWTISSLPSSAGSFSGVEITSALRDVGTTTPNDALGQNGFDVPTLLGLGSSAPYLHDGSATTLEEVLRNPQHAPSLTETETSDLILFLHSIDSETEPVQP
jgi:YVTN family beta-propeller protein